MLISRPLVISQECYPVAILPPLNLKMTLGDIKFKCHPHILRKKCETRAMSCSPLLY